MGLLLPEIALCEFWKNMVLESRGENSCLAYLYLPKVSWWFAKKTALLLESFVFTRARYALFREDFELFAKVSRYFASIYIKINYENELNGFLQKQLLPLEFKKISEFIKNRSVNSNKLDLNCPNENTDRYWGLFINNYSVISTKFCAISS